MIRINAEITIQEKEIELRFIRAAGPGGQNVNKVASAVQLRFDALHSPSLPDPVRMRLMRIAGRRITDEGVLIIEARRFRTQERNRQDALDRLTALIHSATIKPKPRHSTKPSQSSRERRLSEKRRQGERKRRRNIGDMRDV